MQVPLGTFVRSCIEASFDEDVATVVEHALRDYAARLEADAVDLPVPRFWLEAERQDGEVEYEVRIDSRTRRVLDVGSLPMAAGSWK